MKKTYSLIRPTVIHQCRLGATGEAEACRKTVTYREGHVVLSRGDTQVIIHASNSGISDVAAIDVAKEVQDCEDGEQPKVNLSGDSFHLFGVEELRAAFGIVGSNRVFQLLIHCRLITAACRGTIRQSHGG